MSHRAARAQASGADGRSAAGQGRASWEATRAVAPGRRPLQRGCLRGGSAIVLAHAVLEGYVPARSGPDHVKTISQAGADDPA